MTADKTIFVTIYGKLRFLFDVLSGSLPVMCCLYAMVSPVVFMFTHIIGRSQPCWFCPHHVHTYLTVAIIYILVLFTRIWLQFLHIYIRHDLASLFMVFPFVTSGCYVALLTYEPYQHWPIVNGHMSVQSWVCLSMSVSPATHTHTLDCLSKFVYKVTEQLKADQTWYCLSDERSWVRQVPTPEI